MQICCWQTSLLAMQMWRVYVENEYKIEIVVILTLPIVIFF